MEKTYLQFTGTGSAKVSLKRFHTSFMFFHRSRALLVDTGDGISHSLLSLGIDFNKIESILISHFHPDHYTGLPSLINQMKMNQRTEPLNIFVHSSLDETTKKLLLQSYLLPEKMPFKTCIIEYEYNIPFTPLEEIVAIAKGNSHLDKYKEYKSAAGLSFASSSFLLNFEGKKLFFSADVGYEEDLFLFKNEEPDYLIIETSHLNLSELEKILYRFDKGKIYLTHISHDDEDFIIKQINTLSDSIKNRVFIPFDGDKIVFE